MYIILLLFKLKFIKHVIKIIIIKGAHNKFFSANSYLMLNYLFKKSYVCLESHSNLLIQKLSTNNYPSNPLRRMNCTLCRLMCLTSK